MTRVNVDDVAFMDRRFKLLGGRLSMAWQEAIGRCLPVWALAYAKRSAILPAGDIDALAERPGFAAALLDVDLAVEDEGGVYLRGVADRIDFLLIQDAKREKARQAKLSAAGVTSPRRPSRGTDRSGPIVSPAPSPGTIPEEGPYSPDLDLDLDRDLSRAIPPSTAPTPAPGTTPAQSFAQQEQVRLRAIGDLAIATWQRLSDLRMAHAAKLKLEAVLPLPPIHPGNHPRAFEALRERIREEGGNARAVCDHVLRALDEQATETKVIDWLSEKAFLDGPWRTARAAVLKPRRKPAERAPPVVEDRGGPAGAADLAASHELLSKLITAPTKDSA